MRWQTTTEIPPFNFTLNHQRTVLLLGSCFAENIGRRMAYFKFNTILNPTGIVYNPHSLLTTTNLLCRQRQLVNADLQHANNQFFSYDFHSRFSATTAELALKSMNKSLEASRETLPQTNAVFISLGTAFYWWLNAEKRVVNNCHKQPGNLFTQKRLSVDETKHALQHVVELLQEKNPHMQIVFTVSPIRHLKHGSAQNQLSKSILIVAAQTLAEELNNVHYFPSYELLLDDLRDYRFYEEDLIHPNKVAVDYIWEKFSEAFFTPKTIALNTQIARIKNMLNHRLFNATSANTNKFLQKLEKETAQCSVDFTSELLTWKQLNIKN